MRGVGESEDGISRFDRLPRETNEPLSRKRKDGPHVEDTISVYRAELALIRDQMHHRVKVDNGQPRMSIKSLSKPIVEEKPSAERIDAGLGSFVPTSSAVASSRKLLVETCPTRTILSAPAVLNERGGPNAALPDEFFRLLPMVSGVEFSQVTLVSSRWNDDRSMQKAKFLLQGSFLVPRVTGGNHNNKNLISTKIIIKEKFGIVLELENWQMPQSCAASDKTASPFHLTKNSKIVKLEISSVGNGQGSGRLWTQDEMNQLIEDSRTNRSFPLWIRNAQKFVSYAHDRDRWFGRWQQSYAELFNGIGTQTMWKGSIMGPDCLHIHKRLIPSRKNCLNNAYHTSKEASLNRQRSASDVSDMCDLLIQWSWSHLLGKDFVQIVPAAGKAPHHKSTIAQGAASADYQQNVMEQGKLKRLTPQKHQKPPTTNILDGVFQDGFQNLLQLTGGNCREALEILLEALSLPCV